MKLTLTSEMIERLPEDEKAFVKKQFEMHESLKGLEAIDMAEKMAPVLGLSVDDVLELNKSAWRRLGGMMIEAAEKDEE